MISYSLATIYLLEIKNRSLLSLKRIFVNNLFNYYLLALNNLIKNI